MLFNSFEFILAFLPITILGYYLLSKSKFSKFSSLGLVWLVLASLFFYSWWNPWNLPIILISVIFNYFWGEIIARTQSTQKRKKQLFLAVGITANLLLIAYYKYADFFISNINFVSGSDLPLLEVILPLGISFFTFQQIAYLVDAYIGETEEYNFLKYALFVTFFPQLIAGPIVHHKDMMPQLTQERANHFSQSALAIGLSVFTIGLFKKAVIADSMSTFANLAFNASAQGVNLTFSEAWVGALAYTIQLYFDFSGYSDMAIGAAYMLGVKLPLNFNSPYQAISIVDFWRRWHITLSNFLRDYLYIPLGGSRLGDFRRYTNLMITMLLGGLWHGAGWQFVLWGFLHGSYLVCNHGYRSLRKRMGHDMKQDGFFLRGTGWLLTFLAVVVAWVFFRASSISSAWAIVQSMFGFRGIQLAGFIEPYLGFLRDFGITFDGFTVNVGISQKYSTFGIILLLTFTCISPNIYQLMGKYSPTLQQPRDQKTILWNERLQALFGWRPNKAWSAVMGLMAAVSFLCFNRVSEFLYFQF
ncbi:MAG: MBOAT family O-acyltransferase [Leptolyngbyaceae cyanobacterium]